MAFPFDSQLPRIEGEKEKRKQETRMNPEVRRILVSDLVLTRF